MSTQELERLEEKYQLSLKAVEMCEQNLKSAREESQKAFLRWAEAKAAESLMEHAR